MGVSNPQEIRYFTVNSIDYNDVLRIVYERPKGSFMPVSRSYRFPRVQKSLKSNGDGSKAQTVMESSPMMRDALAELEKLLSSRKEKQNIAADMLDELLQLEEEFTAHCEHLKALVDKIKTV